MPECSLGEYDKERNAQRWSGVEENYLPPYRFQGWTIFSLFLNGILKKGEKVDEETLGHFALMVEGLLSGPRKGKIRRLESMMLPQPGADGDKGFWGQVFLRTSLDAVTIVCLWEAIELPVASVLSYIKRNKSNFVVKNRCDNPWQASSLEAGLSQASNKRRLFFSLH